MSIRTRPLVYLGALLLTGVEAFGSSITPTPTVYETSTQPAGATAVLETTRLYYSVLNIDLSLVPYEPAGYTSDGASVVYSLAAPTTVPTQSAAAMESAGLPAALSVLSVALETYATPIPPIPVLTTQTPHYTLITASQASPAISSNVAMSSATVVPAANSLSPSPSATSQTPLPSSGQASQASEQPLSSTVLNPQSSSLSNALPSSTNAQPSASVPSSFFTITTGASSSPFSPSQTSSPETSLSQTSSSPTTSSQTTSASDSMSSSSLATTSPLTSSQLSQTATTTAGTPTNTAIPSSTEGPSSSQTDGVVPAASTDAPLANSARGPITSCHVLALAMGWLGVSLL